MRIEKLEIKNFGKLKELKLEFLNSINIVYGRNEAGKSTLQHFISGMLFGIRGGRLGRDGSLPPLKKYKPWEGSGYGGSLEYRLDSGELYRVERDFDNNTVKIYDSSFNDITNTFDLNRQRGLLFSEKHLGINEICFEKTVFIKQMESKMDENGSRELISRLINVAQSGFEDVSLLKAQQALKEALKEYVGTDKTSSRPLDKVIQRLSELKSQKAEYIEKKSFCLNIENELNEEIKKKHKLQCAKAFLLCAKDTASIKQEIHDEKRKCLELSEAINNIEVVESELQTVLKRVEEFNETKINYEQFGSCSNEDIDEVIYAYNNLSHVSKEKLNLEAELENKKLFLAKTKQNCSNADVFEVIDQNMEQRLLELPKEIERLKIEREKLSRESIDEKLRELVKQDTRNLYGIIISIALALISLAAALFGTPILLAGTLVFLILGLVFIFARIRTSNELSNLKSLKNIAFVNISGIDDEIASKRKVLESILSSVGVSEIGEYFQLKSSYAGIKGQVDLLEHEISECISSIYEVNKQIDHFSAMLLEKFASVGISNVQEINDEIIDKFKYGVRKYWGMDSSFDYAKQRVIELNDNLGKLHTRISNLCGTQYMDIETSRGFLRDAQKKVSDLQENFINGVNELSKEFSEGNFSIDGLETADDLKSVLAIDGQENIIGDLYDRVSEDFSDIVLKITEHETILKSNNIDEDEIFNIDAEIEQLSTKKSLLEDTSISLKTALDVITEAGTEIQKDFAPGLNVKMSRIISEITSGKYSDLRADDQLLLKAVSGDWGNIVTSSALSGGTVDQVYLAMRLSIAELISGDGEALPIILDEVFAQYDDVRMELALRYFLELSRTRQIILFTCKQREVDIAMEVSKQNINVINL